MNIFNKERKSNQYEGTVGSRAGGDRNSVRLNKENSAEGDRSRLSQRKSEIDQAARIVARKMKQMQIAESMRGTEV